MNSNQQSWGWQLLRNAVIFGSATTLTGCFAISFAGALWAVAFSGNYAWGQVVGDTTLGAERSKVTAVTRKAFLIEGGATRGTALFHSFREFSIPTLGIAYFNNASDIQKIISRVTGTSISNIDGLITANGTANLFLINPNGIVFGPNASLDIGGSFLGSTARSVELANGNQFSATNPQTPPLLTINLPIGLQYGSNAGSIQVRGALLEVPTSQALALVGGNVQLDGAVLQVPGGRVELAGVGGSGTVELRGNGNNLSLSFPNEVPQADVVLTNGAEVGVQGGGSGSIAINAKNLRLAGGSRLLAGTLPDLGSIGTKVGDIEINATEAVSLTDESFVGNVLLPGGVGKGGDINITTSSLWTTNKAGLIASTFGRGDAGSVNITAKSISFDGSNALSTVEKVAEGNGGNINITTDSLVVTNGTQLVANTFGRGNAGTVTITASKSVLFDGVGGNGQSSTAKSTVEVGAVGNGGNINIATASLALTNGAQLAASTFGKGDAGRVNITASDRVSLDGVGSNRLSSAVLTTVEAGAMGNGGDINIATGSLALTNGAQLTASTFAKGDAGYVNITASDRVLFNGAGSNGVSSGAFSRVARGAMGTGGDINIATSSLAVTNGAQLVASTFGSGDAGRVNITASKSILFDGVSSNGLSSAAFSSVAPTAVGNGGAINITTNSLSVTNGAQLVANTRGRGDAGNVTITADNRVSFDGTGKNGFTSAAISSVAPTARGNGGRISVTTSFLDVANGAQLVTTTRGRGDAGSVTITASNSASFDGATSDGFPSGVLSTTGAQAVGNGGSVHISTRALSVTNGAAIATSSIGQGKAGDIQITARDLTLNNQASIQAQTISGNGGNMTLNVQDLLLMRHKSLISTSAGLVGQGGDGGNMTINAQFMVTVPKEDSDIRANAYTGRGGNIDITTGGIFGFQFTQGVQNTPLSDISASSELGVQGAINIINTIGVDPSQGLTNLPIEPVDASRQIASNCPARGTGVAKKENKFIITGRGGLPASPNETLQGESVLTNWVTLDSSADNHSRKDNFTNSDRAPAATTPNTSALTEAQGWMYGSNGEVILTHTAPNVTPYNPSLSPVSCSGL